MAKEIEALGKQRDQIWGDFQEVMVKAVAGACQMTARGKHEFLKDIMKIGDKYERDALGRMNLQ